MNTKNSKKISKGIIILLILCFILPGLYCIYLGLNELYNIKVKNKDYISVKAVLTTYDTHIDDNEYMYSSNYTYVVNEKNYNIKSRILTSKIPELGSVIEIKYNPKDPNEAIITTDLSPKYLLFAGFFFTVLPIFAILSSFLDRRKKTFNLLLGSVITFIGIGILIICSFSEYAPFSIMTAIKDYGLILIIPLAFIFFGLYQFIWALITPSEKMAKTVDRAYKIHNAESITEVIDNHKNYI